MALLKHAVVRAPSHLQKSGKQLWLDISSEYLFEAHQLEILRLLCECLDRLETCRKQLKADGLFIVNRFGELRPHVALKEEREHRVLFTRLARELALDLDIPDSPRKPRRY